MDTAARQTPRHLTAIRKAIHKSPLVALPYYEIEVDGRKIRYSAPAEGPLVLGRVQTIFAKEPTTIPFLEAIRPGETLLDIGANIGMYTIYAAVMTGCKVVAVEPEALNFAELNKSIHLNGLSGRVLGLCAAMSDEEKIGPLHLGAFGVSYSHHDFAENSWRKDMKWSETVTTRRDERMTQGSISTTIDALVASEIMSVPEHIKIDVDGLEHRVVAGGRKTFADPRLRTVLIEIDFSIDTAREIVEMMTASGWKYSIAQLRTNRGAVLSEEFIRRVWEEQREGFNYIFYRDEAVGKLYEEFLDRYVPPLDAAGKLKQRPTFVDETVAEQAEKAVGAVLRRAGMGDRLRHAIKRTLGRS
jgi:FkbM family methyltransferase